MSKSTSVITETGGQASAAEQGVAAAITATNATNSAFTSIIENSDAASYKAGLDSIERMQKASLEATRQTLDLANEQAHNVTDAAANSVQAAFAAAEKSKPDTATQDLQKKVIFGALAALVLILIFKK